MQNQSKNNITFDTQLKTALFILTNKIVPLFPYGCETGTRLTKEEWIYRREMIEAKH